MTHFDQTRASGEYGFFDDLRDTLDSADKPVGHIPCGAVIFNLEGSGRDAQKWQSVLVTTGSDDSTSAWKVSDGGSSSACELCGRTHLLYAKPEEPSRVFSRAFALSSRADAVGGLRGLTAAATTVLGSAAFKDTEHAEQGKFRHPIAAALGGLRVVSGALGKLNQWAEYEVVLATRSAVFTVWRSVADVARLVDALGLVRKYRAMPRANLAWQRLHKGSRWLQATELSFMVEQRRVMEYFFEHLLHELPSPIQLLNFVDDATWQDDGATAPRGCPGICRQAVSLEKNGRPSANLLAAHVSARVAEAEGEADGLSVKEPPSSLEPTTNEQTRSGSTAVAKALDDVEKLFAKNSVV